MAKLPNMLQVSFGACKEGALVDLTISDSCKTASLQGVTGRFTVMKREYEKGKDGQTFLRLKDMNSDKVITLGWRQNAEDISAFDLVPTPMPEKTEKTLKRGISGKDVQAAIQLVNDLESRITALENMRKSV